MKVIVAGILATAMLTACASAPANLSAEDAAARQAYRDAWVAARKKATGSVVPGSALYQIETPAREIDEVKKSFPSPAIGDSY